MSITTRPVFHFHVVCYLSIELWACDHIAISPSLVSVVTLGGRGDLERQPATTGSQELIPPVAESNGREISCTREATENRAGNRRGVEDASRVTIHGHHLSLLGRKGIDPLGLGGSCRRKRIRIMRVSRKEPVSSASASHLQAKQPQSRRNWIFWVTSCDVAVHFGRCYNWLFTAIGRWRFFFCF